MPGKSSLSRSGRIDARGQSRYRGRIPAFEDYVMIRLALAALAFALAAPAQAQMYRWVDSAGRVQYSDRPPAAGTKAEQVTKSNVSAVGSQSTSVSGSAKEGGAKTPADLEADFRKRQVDRAEAEKKQQQAAAEQKQNKESCDAARRNLAALQSGQRMARYDAKGEISYMEDADRAREMARAQKQVQDYCK
jgi:hypothetical protein